MYLHSNGKQDYIEELKNKKTLEITQIDDSDHSPKQKKDIIKRIIDKFDQLIKDSEQSLFITQK